MIDLEAALRDLSDDLAVPDVDLVAAVSARLERRRSPWMRPAVALAGVLVAAVLIVAIEPARTAVADWLGIGSTRIDVTDSTLSLDGLPPVVETLGTPATAAEAAAALGMAPALPVDFGDPDLWLVAGGRVTAAWAPREPFPEISGTGLGVLLSQAAGDDPGLALKQAGPGAMVQSVEVGTSRGFWISGDHLRTAADGRSAVAANVLLWIDDGVEFRLETAANLFASLELARMVAAGR